MIASKSLILNGGDTPAEHAFTSYVERVYTVRASALITAMSSGLITVEEWYIAMLVEVDHVTFTAFQLGKGGTQALNDLDIKAIQHWTAEQHTYLALWRDQLRAKADDKGLLIVAAAVTGGVVAEALTGAVSFAGLIARALLYAKTARSLLAVAQTLALGMPILPAYPRDNTSECLMNDACAWEIVPTGPKSWDCYWRVDPLAESCDNCLKRGDVWSPLRIVDGVIQAFDSTGLYR